MLSIASLKFSANVFYANTNAIRALDGGEQAMFRIMCQGALPVVRDAFQRGLYVPTFKVPTTAGIPDDEICDIAFDMGNCNESCIRDAGRSMSVGDLVQIVRGSEVKWYVCASIGWTPLFG